MPVKVSLFAKTADMVLMRTVLLHCIVKQRSLNKQKVGHWDLQYEDVAHSLYLKKSISSELAKMSDYVAYLVKDDSKLLARLQTTPGVYILIHLPIVIYVLVIFVNFVHFTHSIKEVHTYFLNN